MRPALSRSIAATFALLTVPAWAGTFTVLPLTGDADSGISADKAYTVAIDMGDGSNRTVNGAVFTGSGGGANPATNNYSTTGITDLLPSWANPNVSGATGGLFNSFNYQGLGGTETVTLNNLRVGQQYVTTFYNSLWGGPRSQTITTSDGGNITFDPDATPGSLLQYSFTASANSQTFTFTPNQPNASFHQAAFTNEAVGYTALLTDNFYGVGTPNTNDVNFNLAARQGGSLVADLGPISYTPLGNTQVGNPTGGVDGGNYLLTAFGARTSPNFNFNNTYSAGGLSISFDLAPNINGGNPDDWGSINIGASAVNANAFVNEVVPHLGILFRGNGLMQVWDGTSNSTPVTSTPVWGPGGVTNALNHFELLFTDPTDQNPFDGVGQTDVEVFANGVSVYTYTQGGGGYADNYINFGAAAIAGHDNLVIAQVPEPTAFAMLALGSLALLRRRRS